MHCYFSCAREVSKLNATIAAVRSGATFTCFVLFCIPVWPSLVTSYNPVRYNLKRKIAGLPPVTKEWFDSRKEQLSSTAALAAQQTWTDPLTKRRFGSENTYNAFTRSRKYQDLVKKSGQPQPKPYVTIQRAEDKGESLQQLPGVWLIWACHHKTQKVTGLSPSTWLRFVPGLVACNRLKQHQ